MKLFLFYFRKLKKIFYSKKIILILSLSLFTFFLFFALFKSIYGSWWQLWPQNIRSEIALNRLAISIYNDPYCRMKCFLERSLYQKEISKNLDKKYFSKKIEKIIMNEEENLDFRLDLLGLVYSSDSFNLVNMENYLNKEGASLKIKNYIATHSNLNNDNSSSQNYYENLQDLLIQGSLSTEDKISSLKSLSSSNLSLLDFYISLLAVEVDSVFVNEIIRSIASDKNLLEADQKLLFSVLGEIMIEKKYSFTSSRLSIFIFSEFFDKKLDNIDLEFIEKLINSGDLDKFSRYLLIELWNQYLESQYQLPQINQDEWDWYYQQN